MRPQSTYIKFEKGVPAMDKKEKRRRPPPSEERSHSNILWHLEARVASPRKYGDIVRKSIMWQQKERHTKGDIKARKYSCIRSQGSPNSDPKTVTKYLKLTNIIKYICGAFRVPTSLVQYSKQRNEKEWSHDGCWSAGGSWLSWKRASSSARFLAASASFAASSSAISCLSSSA